MFCKSWIKRANIVYRVRCCHYCHDSSTESSGVMVRRIDNVWYTVCCKIGKICTKGRRK